GKAATVGAPQEMELQRMPQARGKRPYASAPAPMSMGRASSLGDEYRGVDEKAAISTGPGLPRWQWRTVSLTWRGPVEASQQIRLVLLSPRLNLLLALLRGALLAALLSRALGSPRSGTPALPTSALVIFAIAAVTAPRAAVAGSFPPPELLKKLEESLLERPECF